MLGGAIYLAVILMHVGHRDKANILQFHPQAKSLLASAGYDCQVILWNLDSLSIALTLNRLPEPVRFLWFNSRVMIYFLSAVLHGMES